MKGFIVYNTNENKIDMKYDWKTIQEHENVICNFHSWSSGIRLATRIVLEEKNIPLERNYEGRTAFENIKYGEMMLAFHHVNEIFHGILTYADFEEAVLEHV